MSASTQAPRVWDITSSFTTTPTPFNSSTTISRGVTPTPSNGRSAPGTGSRSRKTTERSTARCAGNRRTAELDVSAKRLDRLDRRCSIARWRLGAATASFDDFSVTTTAVVPDTASAGAAISANAGTTYSARRRPRNGGLSYSWIYGDGGSSTGVLNPTYTYQTLGTYTAQLTVTDALGIPATSSVTVTVNSSGAASLSIDGDSILAVSSSSKLAIGQAKESDASPSHGELTSAGGMLAASQLDALWSITTATPSWSFRRPSQRPRSTAAPLTVTACGSRQV